MFLPIFLAILVGEVFSTEIPCNFVYEFLNYRCDLPVDGQLVSIAAENEPIQVTGNHVSPHKNSEIRQLNFMNPHVLKFVPTKLFEIMPEIQYFSMVDDKLSTLTTNAFQNFLNMETIQISDNNFPDVPASFAESCVNLRVLSFQQNWIQNVHKDAFKGLAKLEKLTLQRNNFTFLDPATFTHTPILNQ
jgi:Leucine-rich repeat (LRR) protein